MRGTWVALFLAFFTNALAKDERLENLSREHRTWLEEEVVYIITEKERNLFLDLETLDERELFIGSFWSRRDPNRATPVNEFKDEHYRRIEFANEFLGRETALPGWKTDQGKMYIILGEPVEIQRYDGYRQLVSTHVWLYQSEPQSGLPPFFYLVFFKKHDVGSYQLYDPVVDGPRALLATGLTSGIGDVAALDTLREVSYELARASLSFDPSDPGDFTKAQASLGNGALVSKVYASPARLIRTDYVDAWMRYGKRVASDYSFNFVPSRTVFAVLAGPDNTPFVHYSIELDPKNFTLETDVDRTRYNTTVDVSVEVSDQQGKLVEASTKEIYIELGPGEAQQVGGAPFAFQEAFPLVPGDYNVTVMLKNRVVKQYTVAEKQLHVPPISQEVPWISDIVLGYHSELVREELDQTGLRVFQVGPWITHPAADSIFSLSETVEATFQLFGAAPGQRLEFGLYQGREKLQERSTPASEYREGTVHESFPLTGMVGGRYALHVNLIDAFARSVTSHVVHFQVSPRSFILRPRFYSRRSFDVGSPGLLSLRLAGQLLRLTRIDEAQESLDKAVAANNPDLPEARWQLAQVLIEKGHGEAAWELLSSMEADFPNQFEVVVGMGFAAYLNGDFVTAVQFLERAMRMRPADTALLNTLGDSLARLGELPEARATFERSLEMNPQQPKIRERLEAINHPQK